MEPLLLQPRYLSPIWGGPRISQARNLPWRVGEEHGESFDISAHPDVGCTILNGAHAGSTLADALREDHAAILGDVSDEAPLQILAMDAAQTLSVQVHPDEAFAQAHEGDHGKVEAWYILAADPGSTLIGGCTTTDLDALRAAAEDDTIGDRFGKRVPVAEGDFVLIPSGTLHALGAGIFALEVGSLGNTTYRLCDWGRGRELQREKGFAALRCTNEARITHLGPHDPTKPTSERLGVDSGFYRSFVVDVSGSTSFTCDGRYALISCVAGSATITTPGGSLTCGYTTSCLVPACAGSYTISGNCRVLRSIRTERP